MKFLTRTIIALVVFNLAIASPAMAQFGTGPITFTISGNTGVGGVVIKSLGLPDDPVSDEKGYYSVKVNYAWSGTVTPIKKGYTFEPARRNYSKVKADQTNENYDAKPVTLTISGSTGVAGGAMTGLPGNPVTDKHGRYQVTVDHGWAGTVTPTKEGYSFEPAHRRYTKVTSNQDSQDYTPKMLTPTISGNAVIDGTAMIGLPGNIITDQRGYYSATVPYGWSGIVRPAKSGYRFEPPALNYPRVGENLTNQDYAARLESSDAEGPGLYGSGGSRSRSGRRGSTPGMDMMYAPSGSPPRGRSSSRFRPAIPSGAVGRKVLVIPAGEINAKELAETVEDMHVMSHILDEGFKAPRRIQGLFTDLGDFFGRDSRGAEATYLQGFGVLFLMEVNFAFSPPPKKQAQEPTETTKAADSTWQKARREVLSPGMGQEDLADDYDNQMVEELKRELIGAFKHASNIRNVKPDEWIILTVIGGQRQFGMGGMTGGGMGGMGGMSGGMGGSMGMGMGMGGGMSGYSSGGGYATSGYGGAGGMMMGGMASGMGNVYGSMSPSHNTTAFSASTVMTIRAKKTDVDGFARGDLDFEQFQEKVTILTY